MSAQLLKIQAALIWVAVALAMAASMLLFLTLPGVLAEAVEGTVEGQALSDALSYQFSLFFVIPLVLAVVTLLVGDRASSYVSLVAGSLVGLFAIATSAMEAVDLGFDAHLLLAVVGGILALVIAGMGAAGLRSPSPPAPAPHEPSNEPVAVP